MAEPAIRTEGLVKTFGNIRALDGVDFGVRERSVLGLLGPNGAGKTTLIKAILGLVRPAAGRALVHGRPYAEQRRLVAYVPQRGSVDWDFPTSVLDVVTMGRYGRIGWIRRPGRSDREAAREALEKVGMSELEHRQISQLSGGQQQRVFLARALAQDAKLYFMDEPFVGVDATTERAIVTLLQQLREQGKTVVCVHHDLESAPDYFDWLVLLNVRLVATGPLATTFTEENLVKTYGGRMHALRVHTAVQHVVEAEA